MSAYKSLRVPHIQTLFRNITPGPNWSIGKYMDADDKPGWTAKAEDNRTDFSRKSSTIPIYYFTRFGSAFPMEDMSLTPEDASLYDDLPAESMVRLRDDPYDRDYARFAAKRDIVRTRAWNDVHEGARFQLQEELVVECPEIFDDDGELIGLKWDEKETDEETDKEETDEEETDEEENDEQESKDGDEVEENASKSRIDSLIHSDDPVIEPTAEAKNSSLGIKRKAAVLPQEDEEKGSDPVRRQISRRSKRSRFVLTEEDDEIEDASYVPVASTARRQKTSQRISTPISSQQAVAQSSNKKPKRRADAANKKDRLHFPWATKHRLCCAIAKKHFGLDWASLERVFSHLWENDLDKSSQVAGDSKWAKNISTQWRECKREKSQHLWRPVKEVIEAEVPSAEYKAALTEVENAMSELGVESMLEEGEIEELDWEVTVFK